MFSSPYPQILKNAEFNIKIKNLDRILLISILLLGGFLRFYQLMNEGLSYDEIVMINLTETTFDQVLYNASWGRPPTLLFFGYIWIKLLGASTFTVRLLSAFSGLLAIACTYRLGREFFSKEVGLVSSFLMSLSVFHIFFSQDFRYYGLLSFIVPLCVLAYWNALKYKSWLRFAVLSLVSIIAFYTHTHAVFVLIALGLHFIINWSKRSPEVKYKWFTSQLLILLGTYFGISIIVSDLFGPTLDGTSLSPLGHLDETPSFALPFYTGLITYTFKGTRLVDLLMLVPFAAIAMGIVTCLIKRFQFDHFSFVRINDIYKLIRLPIGETKSTVTLLLLWLILPLFLPVLLSYIVGPMYLPRYTIGALPAFYLVVGVLMVRMKTIFPQSAVISAFLILVAPSLFQFYQADVKDQWPEIANYVGSRMQETDGIIFLSVNNEQPEQVENAFKYYSPVSIQTCEVSSLYFNGSEQFASQIENCRESFDRLWVVMRPTSDNQVDFIELFTQLNLDQSYTLVESQSYLNVATYLIE